TLYPYTTLFRSAIVEAEKLGGTCLHKGCIPSKALLRSAEVYRQTKASSDFGSDAKEITLNFPDVQSRNASVVDNLYKGVQTLMRKGKIDVIEGFGRILGSSIFCPVPGTIAVASTSGRQNTLIATENIRIATGSTPKTLPGLEVDGTFVMTSDEALEMKDLPTSMIIVGGGVIGIEWASMLADFGVQITVIEYLERILPSEDEDIAKQVERML